MQVKLEIDTITDIITCRCRFRELDAGGECWAKCDKRVNSCEECGFGGRKFNPVNKIKKVRKNGKITGRKL